MCVDETILKMVVVVVVIDDDDDDDDDDDEDDNGDDDDGIMCAGCADGYYGNKCAEACGQCTDGAVCDKTTGHCPHGCQVGYQPPFCKASE